VSDSGRAFLQVVDGLRRGLSVPLSADRPLVVGRKLGELILDDPLVSSAHCTILFKDGHFVVQDLGSTNGTLVDGVSIVERELHAGAELTVGSSRMLVYLDGAPTELRSDEPVNPVHLEIAWLLDEELVEDNGPRPGGAPDVIGQDLRLPPGLNALVEVVAGIDAGRVFRFVRGNVSVGRRQGEVPLADNEISRHHAVIEIFGRDMIFLRDLGSTNGTYHNGRRITVSKLESGDTIGVGKSVMKLEVSL